MNRLVSMLFSRRALLAWAILAVGLLVVAFVWHGMRDERERSAKAQFELHTRELIASIEKRLRDHEQILLGGAGLFDASANVTRAEWHTYNKRLRLTKNYPGIQGVGFSVVIPPGQLAAHEAQIRAEGFPDYRVKPSGARALYTAIVYLEPFAGRNLAAFGYDMFSESTRHQAMQLAVDAERTTITGKVKLLQETHGKQQAGFLMYVPIYRSGMPLDTAAARWHALRGYVYSPYRVDDLMQGILGRSDLAIDFTIHDGTILSPDTLMFDSAGAHVNEVHDAPEYRARRLINAYDRTWTVTLTSRPAFEAQFASRRDWWTTMLGAGISFSLFGLTLLLLSRREQALALAREMMSERVEYEERFHQLFLHMGQGVVIHGRDGQVLDANPAAERILGAGWRERGGIAARKTDVQPLREDGGDFPADAHPVNVALRTGRAVTGVIMGIWNPEDNRRHWLRVDAYPRDTASSTQAQRVYAVFSDITEQRATDHEARQARKFLSDVLAAATEVSVIATDIDGQITVFNAGAERLLGYRTDEMVGKQTPAILHLSAEVVARGQELSAELGRPIEGFRIFVEKSERDGSEQREWTFLHKDGHRIPVSLVVTPMRDAGGAITGYLGVAEDITQRKQGERALREQALHTQAILDNMVDGLITINNLGAIESVNPAAERIFGYCADEIIGHHVSRLLPDLDPATPDDASPAHETMSTRLLGIGREVEGRRKDGSLFPVELTLSEITRQGEAMCIGMVRDITDRKRVDRMKSEFVSTVSHELRTPLTSISGALGLIAAGTLGVLPPQANELIAIAHKNSKRLTYLINDLLDMEKLAAGKMHFDLQTLALKPLIEQALDANRSYGAERGIALAVVGSLPDVEVQADSQRLMQVLSNLLSNAIKYSPENGVVEVSVTVQDGVIRVTIADTGPGVPATFRSRIFQKFAQADASDTRKRGGTGLGLAITRELVERMSGKIGFDSEEGEGARFYFELAEWGTPTTPAGGTET
ncbi:MAG: CHASE domain-containing protein [Thiobacillus sp.]|nr:CHASE domain-containing protein [Thiobacillus sp.]